MYTYAHITVHTCIHICILLYMHACIHTRYILVTLQSTVTWAAHCDLHGYSVKVVDLCRSDPWLRRLFLSPSSSFLPAPLHYPSLCHPSLIPLSSPSPLFCLLLSFLFFSFFFLSISLPYSHLPYLSPFSQPPWSSLSHSDHSGCWKLFPVISSARWGFVTGLEAEVSSLAWGQLCSCTFLWASEQE